MERGAPMSTQPSHAGPSHVLASQSSGQSMLSPQSSIAHTIPISAMNTGAAIQSNPEHRRSESRGRGDGGIDEQAGRGKQSGGGSLTRQISPTANHSGAPNNYRQDHNNTRDPVAPLSRQRSGHGISRERSQTAAENSEPIKTQPCSTEDLRLPLASRSQRDLSEQRANGTGSIRNQRSGSGAQSAGRGQPAGKSGDRGSVAGTSVNCCNIFCCK
jgi:hypothetical protein